MYRLLFESEDSCYIAHRMANSRLYEGLPEQTFELPIQVSLFCRCPAAVVVNRYGSVCEWLQRTERQLPGVDVSFGDARGDERS